MRKKAPRSSGVAWQTIQNLPFAEQRESRRRTFAPEPKLGNHTHIHTTLTLSGVWKPIWGLMKASGSHIFSHIRTAPRGGVKYDLFFCFVREGLPAPQSARARQNDHMIFFLADVGSGFFRSRLLRALQKTLRLCFTHSANTLSDQRFSTDLPTF